MANQLSKRHQGLKEKYRELSKNTQGDNKVTRHQTHARIHAHTNTCTYARTRTHTLHAHTRVHAHVHVCTQILCSAV